MFQPGPYIGFPSRRQIRIARSVPRAGRPNNRSLRTHFADRQVDRASTGNASDMRSSPRPRYRPTARVSVLDIVPGARFSLKWRAMLGAVIDSIQMALTHAIDQLVRCPPGLSLAERR